MNEEKVNINVIRILHKNKATIMVLGVLFLAVALTVSFFVPKKYSAMGVAYPTHSNSIKEVVNKPVFGYDVQSDRLIQLFQSQMMQNKLIEEFDLITYYEIDSNELGWRNRLVNNLDSDITLNRTKYLSVELTVETKSAQLSANMVNFMLDYVDVIRKEMFNRNTVLLVEDLNLKVIEQQERVDAMLTQIFEAVELGDPNILANNTAKNIEERKRKATSLYGDEVVAFALKNNYSIQMEKMVNEYYFELGKLNNLKRDLSAGEEKLSLPFPKIYRLMTAEINEKKSSPSFLLNGAIGLILGLSFGVFFFVGKEKWSEISATILND